MSWRDSLRPASFRGVPFAVDVLGGSDGRRLVVHEFPRRDQPFVEDLGRAARKLTVSAYVIGPDYLAARDKLLDACTQEGPGALVHPTMGEIQVAVESVTWTERREEGGLCRIDIGFVVDPGAAPSPTSAVDTAAAVETAAGEVDEAALAGFGEAWSVAGWPDFVPAEARDVLGRLLDLLRDQTAAGYDLSRQLGAFGDMIGGDALPDAQALGAGILGLVDGVSAAAGPERTETMLARLPGLLASGMPAAASGASPSARAAAGNQAAVQSLLDLASLAVRSRTAASRTDLEARPDALRLRDRLSTDIETARVAAGDAGQDEAYTALGRLRSAVGSHLGAVAGALADVAVTELPRAVPVLVAAQRLYGDADRAGQLAARNAVRHPAFGPPRLEYLTT